MAIPSLGEIYKICNKLPPFRSIFSAIITPTYKLTKFFLKFLTSSTANEYTVRRSLSTGANLHMASLDGDSLFTNIPLDKTINICIDDFYNGNENPSNFSKHDFRKLLNIDTKVKENLSSKHPNIIFSIEKEKDGCLPIVDVNIFLEKNKFATDVYRRKIFRGVYTKFKIFIPETYKIGLIKSLLFRCQIS